MMESFVFIDKLIIENDKGCIRNIEFHKGLNLIIDETPKDRKKSGNNIGKTTVLKLIDFCLGGDGNKIYKDKEFPTNNESLVENFLKNTNVIITLILVDDLENTTSEIVIKRNFLPYKKKISEINGENFSNNDKFEEKLNELIFHNKGIPTFRQIISKNIRYGALRLQNIIKVLDASEYKIRNDVYEALYFFWFGISTENSERKTFLTEQKRIEEAYIKRLGESPEIISQKLKVIENDIKEKEKLKDSLNVNEHYKDDLNKLNDIKYLISEIKTKMLALETRKSLINESKKDLEKSKSAIDPKIIKSIYDEAKVFIPNLQKRFEDVLNFHNKMIENKMDFILQDLPNIVYNIYFLNNELDNLLEQEKKIAKVVSKSNTFEELSLIVKDLNKFYEEKGRLEEKLYQWNDANSKLNDINMELRSINDLNKNQNKLIEERMAKFNSIFSTFSEKLYSEKYILSCFIPQDKNEKSNYTLSINTAFGSPEGSGRKITQISAFDLAYIKFADDLSINCLHFVLTDEIEKIHSNQINTVLLDLVNSVNCQYIISVLKDKLPDAIDYKEYETLTLSENDKLFKIENNFNT